MKFIDGCYQNNPHSYGFQIDDQDALVIRSAYRRKHEASKRTNLEPPFPDIDVEMRGAQAGKTIIWDIRSPTIPVEDVIDTMTGYRDALSTQARLGELGYGVPLDPVDRGQLQRKLSAADKVIGALAMGRDATLCYQQIDQL